MSTELPVEGSIMFGVMNGEKSKSNKTIKKFKFWNKYFIIPMYRFNILPFFFVGKIFILLQTEGRKSGKKRYSPLEYRVKDDNILLFSSRGKYSDWYRNLSANPDKVYFKKGFKWFKPNISEIDTIEEINEIIKWYCTKFPKSAKGLFGWDKNMIIEETNIQPLTKFIKIIKLEV